MTEITLPSGAILKITIAPFADAKALYQAILEEIKGIEISSKTDIASMFKDIACTGFSSKKIEACLETCFKRCTYNSGKGELKIDKDTFEPIEARNDYMAVCLAVTKENVLPFMKSLYAEYLQYLTKIQSVQA